MLSFINSEHQVLNASYVSSCTFSWLNFNFNFKQSGWTFLRRSKNHFLYWHITVPFDSSLVSSNSFKITQNKFDLHQQLWINSDLNKNHRVSVLNLLSSSSSLLEYQFWTTFFFFFFTWVCISFESANSQIKPTDFHFQAEEIKCNFKDGLADRFWDIFPKFLSTPQKVSYLHGATYRGYWSTQMDHHHNHWRWLLPLYFWKNIWTLGILILGKISKKKHNEKQFVTLQRRENAKKNILKNLLFFSYFKSEFLITCNFSGIVIPILIWKKLLGPNLFTAKLTRLLRACSIWPLPQISTQRTSVKPKS